MLEHGDGALVGMPELSVWFIGFSPGVGTP